MPKKLIPNNSEEKIYNSEKKKYNSEEKIYNSALTAFSPSSKEVTTFEVKSVIFFLLIKQIKNYFLK